MNEKDAAKTLETLMDLAVEDERKGLPTASPWHRYELCAASFQLELEAKRLGQEAFKESEAAIAGKRIHALLAGQIVLNPSEDETYAANFLRQRANDQIQRIFGDAPVTVLTEQRLWLNMGDQRVASGRFDRMVYYGKVALVQDFKTGFAEPDPAEINAQLKFLSVVVAIHLPQVTEVVAQIVSRAYGVTETRYTIAQLSEAYRDIVSTLKKINDPHAAFSPSAEACRYCPAVTICQATKDLIKPVAKLNLSALPDGERASRLLDEVELLKRHLAAIEAYYSSRLTEDSEYKIPGWDMAPGAPKRTVTDWPAARAKLEEFVDGKALDALATFTLSGVEKLLGQTIGVKGAKLKEQFAQILGDLLELKYPEPSLKRVKGKPEVAALIEAKD